MKSNTVKTLALFLLTIVLRIPFRSQYLYHWDSVNFALAIEQYDINKHQPHPPGYILYVMLGRLVNTLLHDPNSSLVWISVVFSGLTAVVLFHLGREMFGERVGWIAALLFITSPAFWFYSEVALSYMTEAFFVTILALLCYRVLSGDDGYLLVCAFALGLAGGFRQNTLFLMAPLFLFSVRHYSAKRLVSAFLLLIAVVGWWFGWMVINTGGLERYLQTTAAAVQGHSSFKSSGLLSVISLAENVGRMTMFFFYSLGLGVTVLPLSALNMRKTSINSMFQNKRAAVLFFWIVPSMLLYIMYINHPGYTFTFMPAFLLIISSWVSKPLPLRRIRGRFVFLAAAALMVFNVTFFLLAPSYLLGYRKIIATTTSWTTIKLRDRYLGERISAIKRNFPASRTAILANSVNFRHPNYYLRDYQVTPLSYQIQSAGEITLVDPINTLVLFDEDLQAINRSPEKTRQLILPSGESLYYITWASGEELSVSPSTVVVRSRQR